ncbi:hypothetical protein T440DRAFT_224769, partial [Plenodomus tracheiphilus IPT5]
ELAAEVLRPLGRGQRLPSSVHVRWYALPHIRCLYLVFCFLRLSSILPVPLHPRVVHSTPASSAYAQPVPPARHPTTQPTTAQPTHFGSSCLTAVIV